MNPVLTQRRDELKALCRRFGVRRLELFGSAAAGKDRAGESDLDFLVEFGPLPPGGYADAYFGLLESLETLFGRPVDLVVASAIKNPYFREAVERTKALLYAA
ncbi:MAG TPA: nucleotidyltransferase domain-containing protein [Candidatus Acidoferrales bacterium]|nr:nucleotidyltransferase domain-containing protein [Candidatus Acidoferrales bacterium]